VALQPAFRFYQNPALLIAAAIGISLMVFLYRARKDPIRYAVSAGLWAFVTILAMSYAREVLRMNYVGRFAYSIFDYKVNLDLGSTALFLGTFIMGMIIIGYQVYIAYASGRTAGTYDAPAVVDRWGKVSLTLLLVWIASVAGLGIVITVKNYL